MKKANKKALAWLLSLCMMLAMIPAIPAQTADAIIRDDGGLQYYYWPAVSTLAEAKADTVHSFGNKAHDYKYVDLYTGTGSNVTTLSQWATDSVTYDLSKNDSKKYSPWQASSVFVSNPGDSTAWARAYSGYAFAVFANGANKASFGTKLKIGAGEGGWYKLAPTFFAPKLDSGANAKVKVTVKDSVGATILEKNFSKDELFGANADTKWTQFDAGVAYFDQQSEYELIVEVSANGGSASDKNIAYYRQIDLIVAEAVEEEEDSDVVENPADNAAIVYDFTKTFTPVTEGDAADKSGSRDGYYRTLIETAPDIMSAFAKTLTYDFSEAKGSAPWKLVLAESKADSVRAYELHGLRVGAYKSVGRQAKAGVRVKVKPGQEGLYKATVTSLCIIKTGTVADAYVKLYKGKDANGTLIGTFNVAKNYGTFADKFGVNKLLDSYYFEAGEYYLEMSLAIATSNSTDELYVRNLTLSPIRPTNSNVFGKVGAYVQKTESGTYSATFFSGINSLDYKEVGFIVSVPGVGSMKLTTDKAYENVIVAKDGGNVTVDGASFGMKNSYVFMATKDGIPTSITSATFQPYAIDLEGNEITGKAFTATYVAQ